MALYVPWCRHLESLPDVKPQLYADNLKCSAARPRALFESPSFTAQYVQSVGQDVSPGKCVLLSTSKTVRKAMKLWDVSGGGGLWTVQLDVRDLGGYLDFTLRARAGTLSKRLREATRFCGKRDGDGQLFWECPFPSFNMSGNYRAVLIRLTLLVPGLLLIIGMLMTLPQRCRSILIFGLMVAGKTSLL